MTELQKKIRLSVDVTAEVYELLQRLADQLGITASDVLRRGIALMHVVNEANKNGKELAIVDDDGNVQHKIIAL